MFKDWLKQSLLKQRDEHIEKRFRDQEKKEVEDREKKAAANKKIMARIAYKEWKERKLEEERQQKKRERMEMRQQMMAYNSHNPAAIALLRRQNARQQHAPEVMLAYGLNKKVNLRPKSAKPMKKKGKKQQYMVPSEETDQQQQLLEQQRFMQAQYQQHLQN